MTEKRVWIVLKSNLEIEIDNVESSSSKGKIRDVVAPNIAKRPRILFIFIILMYLCNLSPSN